ncbi:MAG TPA: histidine kinase [Streptosporangiaceae bacterium]|jgi:signal transduction histidine kinase|nr:histidine kinase [Streptosporangiaceae bacterium]
MVTDSRPARSRPPLGLGSSLTAAYYGLGLAGLIVAEVGLVLVLLGWVLLAAAAIASVPVGPGDGHQRILLLLLFLTAGLAIGRFFVSPVLLALRQLAGLTRRLAGEWCGVPIAESYQPPPADPAQLPYTARLRWLLTDAATWRDLRWVVVNALVGWILAAASAALIVVGGVAFLVPVVSRAIPPPAFPGNTKPVLAVIGCAMVVTGVAAAPWLLRGYGLLAARILAPSGQAELALRVRHLSQTRTEALDTGAAEIRRIERDLHDGAQARLVAMGMTLDAAGQIIDTNPDAARALLSEARDSSVKALAELRALVRGIHPPVLADRGLGDAIAALTLDMPLRIHLASDLYGRPPAPVESAAFFAVSELLANVSKHAEARETWIDIRHTDGMLRIGVTDNGHGGADPARGSGLRGIERRLAPFDGILAISSPPGGPTAVTMEIPCELSLPKTSSS